MSGRRCAPALPRFPLLCYALRTMRNDSEEVLVGIPDSLSENLARPFLVEEVEVALCWGSVVVEQAKGLQHTNGGPIVGAREAKIREELS